MDGILSFFSSTDLVPVSKCQLEVLLENFYKDGKLDFYHRGGKINELPRKCLKNIVVTKGKKTLSLKKHISYKEDEFMLKIVCK